MNIYHLRTRHPVINKYLLQFPIVLFTWLDLLGWSPRLCDFVFIQLYEPFWRGFMTSEVPYVALDKYDWGVILSDSLPWNPTVYCLTASFFAVALWLSIEITIYTWFRFKQHKTLYFWSILITTWGVAMYTVLLIIMFFIPGANNIGTTVLVEVAWVANTTGFSFVLYSRLHLVLYNSKLLSCVVAAIIINGILFHTPAIVFALAMTVDGPHRWREGWFITERIQIVVFTVQETVISSIYTWNAAKLLHSIQSGKRHNVLALLIFAQAAIFSSDTVLIVVHYMRMSILKGALHPFIYAIKLKIEFVVLNQLCKVVGYNGASERLPHIADNGLFSQSDPSRRSSQNSTLSDPWRPSLEANYKGSSPLPVTMPNLSAKPALGCSTPSVLLTASPELTNRAAVQYNEAKRAAELSPGEAYGTLAKDGDIEQMYRHYLGNWDEDG